MSQMLADNLHSHQRQNSTKEGREEGMQYLQFILSLILLKSHKQIPNQ